MLQLVEHSRALQLVADSIMQKTLICQQIQRFGVSLENQKTKNHSLKILQAEFKWQIFGLSGEQLPESTRIR